MKILLVCNAGMSTGIMKMKLEQEAKARGFATIPVLMAMYVITPFKEV